nr:MAG TPA: hypothetical protein [Caudoviricetes sp.]
MTEYKLVESMQSDKPLDIDTTSSPNIVYQRKNIKSVEATGSEDDFTYKPKHWEYEERELTQDEYSQYLIAMEKTFRILVQSLKRLYQADPQRVTKKDIDKRLKNGTINQEEYDYILN